MKYCSERTCREKTARMDTEGDYCRDCGNEMIPCIRCLCGQEQFNPSYPAIQPKFCPQCGHAITDAYLSECMKVQLGSLVSEIAEKMASA